jgi:hypothetical protein
VKNMKEITMGRTSLATLYSRRLEMSCCQSPRVDTPQVGVLQLPSRVPPRVGTTCAYLSWFVFFTELNRLPEKPGVNLVCMVPSEGLLVSS